LRRTPRARRPAALSRRLPLPTGVLFFVLGRWSIRLGLTAVGT
jgi:hypothetical protein